MGYAAPGKSEQQILSIAESIRLVLDLQDDEKIYPHTLLECLSVNGILNYEYCEDREVALLGEALYRPETNTIIVPDSVYIAACNDQGRARFTIAHELGHKFLDHRIPLARGVSEGHPIYMDKEWQANEFASLFLAPPRLVRKYSTSEEVAIHFGLSLQAAEIALNKAKKAKHMA